MDFELIGVRIDILDTIIRNSNRGDLPIDIDKCLADAKKVYDWVIADDSGPKLTVVK